MYTLKKMKVLLIVWNFYPNTAYTNHTKATVRGFRESGAQCDVFSIKPLSKAEDVALNNEFTGTKSFLKTAAGMLYNFGRLTRIAKRYDVIYCTTSNLRVMKCLLKFARKNNKIIVHERTEYPDVFMSANCSQMKKYCKLVEQFDKVFVISTFIKKFFVDRGVAESKLQVYPMIVDPNRFAGIEKQNVGYRYIAYCGNLQNSKDGVADLIEAFGTSQNAKNNFILVLIGEKPSSDEMTIYETMISKYSLTDKVVFAGQIQHYDMPQMLKNADILALCRPANHQAEGGFPTKLGEYLSTANPVLVTNVGDMGLYIKDGINGYVSQADKISMFRDKLDYIVTHYEEAIQVGVRGKELVYSVFNYKVQTNIVLQSLKTLK
ncbi:glycosyltransferase family 4 protein [Bacteroides thetaiotaomicron]|uniref:glycosyltransferase family 4 protein n=1 Tax=Bacteroides thetaiotaomicron TaxID=818 RepID=UPI001926922F|nr:glycosyltransferase family 4 protein [Bacteroides thetaiotaomicron]